MPDVHPLILLAHAIALLVVVIDFIDYLKNRERYTLELPTHQASTQSEVTAARD